MNLTFWVEPYNGELKGWFQDDEGAGGSGDAEHSSSESVPSSSSFS